MLQADLFSVAPMVDVTNSLFRRMARVMSRQCMLYTEMIAADAIVHGKEQLLAYREEELPMTLQLGGNDPHKMAYAAKVGERLGYSCININAGCPSDKVQQGAFGAVLMKDIPLLCDIVKAMQDAVSVPVTVKTRIGVDDLDSFDFTLQLVSSLYEAGVRHLILHARKAWLNGLSPRQNRTVPPLDYERVFVLKSMFPDLAITINGGITTMAQCQELLTKVDGVMLGRAVMDDPYILEYVDSELFGVNKAVRSRDEVFACMLELAKEVLAEGVPLHHFASHLLGFFTGCAGARRYRRVLSEKMNKPEAGVQVLQEAYQAMQSCRS